MVNNYHQGAIVLIEFNPQAGHEQAGYRPAIIISNDTMNRVSNVIMVCPITNSNNKHPLHVPLNGDTKTTGYILCEHAKSLDLAARHAKYVEDAPGEVLSEVLNIVKSFF